MKSIPVLIYRQGQVINGFQLPAQLLKLLTINTLVIKHEGQDVGIASRFHYYQAQFFCNLQLQNKNLYEDVVGGKNQIIFDCNIDHVGKVVSNITPLSITIV